ncbi:MAG: ArsA family ATPase [Bacteriovoracia bacterium]
MDFSKRVIIVCGTGGVGKTTMSAAIAIAAAKQGKRAVVVTIDPAKRLATSLGLKSLNSDPVNLTHLLSEVKTGGEFFAVMPDTAQTFEKLIQSLSGSNSDVAGRIFKNSIYKIFTKDFSGTNEYMAMEKLNELYSKTNEAKQSEFDLIVLDTPPSVNTKFFLEAPKIFAGFFDEKIVQWFINPGSKILAIGLKKVIEVLERVTGKGFIAELIEFITVLFELRTQFVENLKKISELLKKPEVSFYLVTSAERMNKADTHDFLRLLREGGYPFEGFILNKVVGMSIFKNELNSAVEALGSNEKDAKTFFLPLIRSLEHEELVLNDLNSQTTCEVIRIAERPKDIHTIQALNDLSDDLLRSSSANASSGKKKDSISSLSSRRN